MGIKPGKFLITIRSINGTQTNTTVPGQSGSGSNVNEGLVLHS